jgi:hypothetical protein
VFLRIQYIWKENHPALDAFYSFSWMHSSSSILCQSQFQLFGEWRALEGPRLFCSQNPGWRTRWYYYLICAWFWQFLKLSLRVQIPFLLESWGAWTVRT